MNPPHLCRSGPSWTVYSCTCTCATDATDDTTFREDFQRTPEAPLHAREIVLNRAIALPRKNPQVVDLIVVHLR